jgi:hypothetical protein
VGRLCSQYTLALSCVASGALLSGILVMAICFFLRGILLIILSPVLLRVTSGLLHRSGCTSYRHRKYQPVPVRLTAMSSVKCTLAAPPCRRACAHFFLLPGAWFLLFDNTHAQTNHVRSFAKTTCSIPIS